LSRALLAMTVEATRGSRNAARAVEFAQPYFHFAR